MDFRDIVKLLNDSESDSRTQGFSSLAKFLKSTQLVKREMLKVWSSIFYCMCYSDFWMADKSYEKIAEKIVALNKGLKKPFEWYECFFETMRKEWEQLDSARIDRFVYLVRIFLKNSLKTARDNKELWKDLLEDLLKKCENQGIKFLFSLAYVYLDEMGGVAMAEKIEFVEPFINLMKSTKLVQVCDLIYDAILLKLLENREKCLGDWVLVQANSRDQMTSRAREKFYELWAMIQGEDIPNRGKLIGSPSMKKKTNSQGNLSKSNEKKNKNRDIYSNKQEESIDLGKVGKDAIELLHGNNKLGKAKRKAKKSEAIQVKSNSRSSRSLIGFNVKSEESLGKSRKSKHKSVSFALKLNTTQIFDEHCKVSSTCKSSSTPPHRSILKSPIPPRKKQKLT